MAAPRNNKVYGGSCRIRMKRHSRPSPAVLQADGVGFPHNVVSRPICADRTALQLAAAGSNAANHLSQSARRYEECMQMMEGIHGHT